MKIYNDSNNCDNKLYIELNENLININKINIKYLEDNEFVKFDK